jgi:hypothetical protein
MATGMMNDLTEVHDLLILENVEFIKQVDTLLVNYSCCSSLEVSHVLEELKHSGKVHHGVSGITVGVFSNL